MLYEAVLTPYSLPTWRIKQLVAQCYPVARDAFGVPDSEEFLKDVENHIINCSGLVVATDTSIKGFCAFQFVPFGNLETLVYLSGVAVAPDCQGQGVAKGMISRVIIEDIKRSLPDAHAFVPLPRFSWVVMRTQSPRMKQVFDKAIGSVSFPNGKDTPHEAKQIAHYAMRWLDTDCDDNLIVKGAYGHSLYSEIPTAQDEAYNKAFACLDHSAGDSQVCVWHK